MNLINIHNERGQLIRWWLIVFTFLKRLQISAISHFKHETTREYRNPQPQIANHKQHNEIMVLNYSLIN